ncbi:hypothetical protein FXE84_19190 [Vibrio cholerae]|nr:hypothetical protein FXE84_19190 [Vibrio cholerae]
MIETNARLRGWQRITTKLNHNSRNHHGSLGLKTPRVGSPFEAFVRAYFHYTLGLLIFLTHHFLCHYNHQKNLDISLVLK